MHRCTGYHSQVPGMIFRIVNISARKIKESLVYEYKNTIVISNMTH